MTGLFYGRLPDSELAGSIGIVCVIALLITCCATKKTSLNPRLFEGSLLLIAFGITSICLTTCVRGFVSPTYGAMSIWFWLGWVGLAFLSFEHARLSKRTIWLAGLGLITLVIIFAMSLRSARFDDKQYYLDNRAPVCQEILRNYRVAPKNASDILYKMPQVEVARLAAPLESHRWSVFGNFQSQTLQGNMLFPWVRESVVGDGAVYWVEGVKLRKQNKPRDWKSYKFLNLALRNCAEITWEKLVPIGAKRVIFK